MLSQLQIGYLAGILDGEGAISITRVKRDDDKKRKRDYSLRADVRITQRRRLLLTTILDWIGEENGKISATGLDNRFFVLRLRHVWLRDHLALVLPHLVLKRRQAEIVLEFLSHPARVGRNGVGDEAWSRRNALRDECKALNLDRTNALS